MVAVVAVGNLFVVERSRRENGKKMDSELRQFRAVRVAVTEIARVARDVLQTERGRDTINQDAEELTRRHIDLQHAIAQEHWYVCGYKMNMK